MKRLDWDTVSLKLVFELRMSEHSKFQFGEKNCIGPLNISH